jgi:hypothetical protein
MRRNFRYYVQPEEIRKYIESLGYRIEDMCLPGEQEPWGFRVCDTTIELSYDLIMDGDRQAWGTVGIYNTPLELGDEEEKAERSRKLYLRLHRKFNRPH